jgi:hypothetical protein
MQVRPRETLTGQKLGQGAVEKPEMQRLLEKWVLSLWQQMPVRPRLEKLGRWSSSARLRGYLPQRELLIFKIAKENRLI